MSRKRRHSKADNRAEPPPGEAAEVNIRLDARGGEDGEAGVSPETEPGRHVHPYGEPADAGLAVYIRAETYEAIEAHAVEDTSRELGGVLLGRRRQSGNRQCLEVADFIAAEHSSSEATSLTFTHETWDHINREKEKRPGDLRIVGWYHTHPGFGIFLSKHDLFIHRNFFNEPWQVALVVDPINHSRGVFRWDGGQITAGEGFYFFSDERDGDLLNALVERLQAEEEDVREREQVVRQEPTQSTPQLAREPEPIPAQLNLFHLLPRFLHPILDITDERTAPRLPVKDLVILVLAALVVAQFFLPGGLRSVSGVRGFRNRAQTYLKLGEVDAALHELRQAAVRRPDDPGVLLELSRAYRTKARGDGENPLLQARATALLRRAVGLMDPSRRPTELEQELKTEARDVLLSAEKIDPVDAAAFRRFLLIDLQRATKLVERGRFKHAYPYAREAARNNPLRSDVREILFLCRYALGNIHLEDVLAVGPDGVLALMLAAQTAARKEDTQALRRALSALAAGRDPRAVRLLVGLLPVSASYLASFPAATVVDEINYQLGQRNDPKRREVLERYLVSTRETGKGSPVTDNEGGDATP